MTDLTLNANDLPGIRDTYRDWRMYPSGRWLSVVGWLHHDDCLLPLDQPMARDLAVRWLASWRPCPQCGNARMLDLTTKNPSKCPGCKGEGVSYDCVWARELPEALAECCRRVGRGEKPLLGTLEPWRSDGDGFWWRQGTGAHFHAVQVYRSLHWTDNTACTSARCSSIEEGKRLADEAARKDGWWLL